MDNSELPKPPATMPEVAPPAPERGPIFKQMAEATSTWLTGMADRQAVRNIPNNPNLAGQERYPGATEATKTMLEAAGRLTNPNNVKELLSAVDGEIVKKVLVDRLRAEEPNSISRSLKEQQVSGLGDDIAKGIVQGYITEAGDLMPDVTITDPKVVGVVTDLVTYQQGKDLKRQTPTS